MGRASASPAGRLKTIVKLAGLVQTGWSMFGLALALILVADCSLQKLMDRRHDGQYRAMMSGYPDPDHEWLPEYLKEMAETDATEWRPYVYWRRRPNDAQYLQVDADGLRRTWNDPNAGEVASKVFMFGGSTMWGTGARADHTMASCLSRELAGMGRKVRVTNFGEGGYVSTQEVLTLFLELRKGNVPDVAIFVDGLNEPASTYAAGKAGLTSNEQNRVDEFNADKRSRLEKAISVVPGVTSVVKGLASRIHPYALKQTDTPALVADTVRVYRENMRLVAALGKEYGFRVLFYWQPMIFTKDHLAPNEVTAAAGLSYMKDFALACYAAVTADPALRKRDEFHDVSEIFRSTSQGMYADPYHFSEVGNGVMGRRIAQDVAQLIP